MTQVTSKPSTLNRTAAPAETVASDAQTQNAAGHRDGMLLPVTTLMLWFGCLTIGCIGIVLPYDRPRAQPKAEKPIQANILNVQLGEKTLPSLSQPASRPPERSEPPSLAEPVPAPAAPQMIALVDPTTAIAFAVPAEKIAPVLTGSTANQARQTQPGARVVASAPPVQTIRYGEGEGKQPAPEYPPRAMREGQEGTVKVRFSVGENGRVLAAEVVSPSAWPLLNEAALKAVRSRWRFATGAVRLHEVSIRFELAK